jgi:replicative DNA helicase
MSIAAHTAVAQKISTAYFTLEQSSHSLALRLISHLSQIGSSQLRTAMLDTADFAKLKTATAKILESPLYIVDEVDIDLDDLMNRARHLCYNHAVEIIFIDDLTLINLKNRRPRKVKHFEKISRELKGLALELEIPIVVLTQLPQSAGEGRPDISDLRKFGSLKYNADLILFLNKKRNSDCPATIIYKDQKVRGSEVELIIAKSKNFPPVAFNIAFLAAYAKFDNF